jgi:hypothetical protein
MLEVSGPLPDRSKPAPTKPAAETGRGGEQHRYLQTLIRRLAEERGFRVSLEVSVLSGTGNIDVVVERENLSVACEISVTTPTGHEVGNLQKCLAAGFERVLLVSPTNRILNRVRKRAAEVFAPDELSKLHFILPEAVPEWLDQISLPAARSETVKGYTVKVEFSAPDAETKERKLSSTRFARLSAARCVGRGKELFRCRIRHLECTRSRRNGERREDTVLPVGPDTPEEEERAMHALRAWYDEKHPGDGT